MTLDEFRKEFIETVRAVAAAEENFELSAFVDVAVRNLVDAGEIADFEPCHYRGVGSKRRTLSVDGFSFDDADDSVRLLVADWRGKERVETLTQTDAATLIGRVRAFAEEALTGRFHDELEIASEPYGLAKQLY